MELKQGKRGNATIRRTLLIVPYGIETANVDNKEVQTRLLIVPYGIETCLMDLPVFFRILLIVPYGIETGVQLRIRTFSQTFNRTLWN